MTRYALPGELTVEADGPVRILTINRPDDLNAVNAALHAALAGVWRQLAADDETRVVILTGAGRTFCAGGDFEYLMETQADPALQHQTIDEARQLLRAMIAFPLPVIAAVNGPAVGLGCSLAIMCDIVLVADSAHFADPHVSVGLVAGDGGAAVWPVLTSLLRAKEYLFTGDRIPPAEAVAMGLATRVVAASDLQHVARELAGRLARQPSQALRETKRVVNMRLAMAMGAIDAGLDAEGLTMASRDYGDRLRALRPTASPR